MIYNIFRQFLWHTYILTVFLTVYWHTFWILLRYLPTYFLTFTFRFSDMQYGMTSILACPKLYSDRSSDISSVYPDRCLYRKLVAHQTGRRADTERALACCSIWWSSGTQIPDRSRMTQRPPQACYGRRQGEGRRGKGRGEERSEGQGEERRGEEKEEQKRLEPVALMACKVDWCPPRWKSKVVHRCGEWPTPPLGKVVPRLQRMPRSRRQRPCKTTSPRQFPGGNLRWHRQSLGLLVWWPQEGAA